MFTATAFSSQDIVRDGLVLWLDANDKTSYPDSGTVWRDLSLGGNDGALTNGPTFDSDNGGSIVFDGVNDYCSLPNLALNYPFHISFWGKATSASSICGITFTDPNSDTKSIGLQINTIQNNIRITYHDSTFTSAFIPGYINTIYKVSGNFTSTSFDLYVNGLYGASLSGAKTKIWTDTSTSYNISLLNRPSIFYYSGNIYNTQIYNRALSATEILQNYNATKSRFGL